MNGLLFHRIFVFCFIPFLKGVCRVTCMKYLYLLLLICFCGRGLAQEVPQSVRSLLAAQSMKGASFSLMVKEVHTGKVLCDYDAGRQLTPASVMKLVTTATALELLGEEFRFATTLEYDGVIKEGVLHGNLYIKGSGDPTLGSAHFAAGKNSYRPSQNSFIPQWLQAVKKAGIRKIAGRVVADESIFDVEGVSLKWVQEDLGSYYGAGSYGISVFDNLYKLFLKSGAAGQRPALLHCDPAMSVIRFHNYLQSARVQSDSTFIVGAPFASDRYLYGVVPANRETIVLKGDIPDPALFLAIYLQEALEAKGIEVEQGASCYRLLQEAGVWHPAKREVLATTYSPSLLEIVEKTNHVSHNLFADALLKTIGLRYKVKKGEVISSFERGIKILRWHWAGKGFDLSPLWMYDGSGLAVTDKVSAAFMADLLCYMATKSSASEAFVSSLPLAGEEGSVRNFLKGSALQGKASFKSGSMSRVKSYAGYINKGNKRYAVAVIANNYAGEGRTMTRKIEQLLLSLFKN